MLGRTEKAREDGSGTTWVDDTVQRGLGLEAIANGKLYSTPNVVVPELQRQLVKQT